MNSRRMLWWQARGQVGSVARVLTEDPWLRWSLLGPATLVFLVLGIALGL